MPTVAFDYGAARECLRDGVHGAAIARTDDAAGDDARFGKRAWVGFVLERTIAVQLQLFEDGVGRGSRVRLVVGVVVVGRHGSVSPAGRPRTRHPRARSS